MTDFNTIRNKLEKQFSPEYLEVIDFSDSHKGHAGYDAGGTSHVEVVMTSAKFSGKNKLSQQRMVYDCLKQELKDNQIHALKLDLKEC